MIKSDWINFRDKLPRNGTFTIQRKTPDTPLNEYSYGQFYYAPENAKWMGFDKYKKTAQWKRDII